MILALAPSIRNSSDSYRRDLKKDYNCPAVMGLIIEVHRKAPNKKKRERKKHKHGTFLIKNYICACLNLHKNRKLKYFQCDFFSRTGAVENTLFRFTKIHMDKRKTKLTNLKSQSHPITCNITQRFFCISCRFVRRGYFLWPNLVTLPIYVLIPIILQKFFSLVYVDDSIYETFFAINIYVVLIIPCLG